MELINATRMVAGYTMGAEPSGRELLVVAVKGTFRLPVAGEPLALAEVQEQLVVSDLFHGEPGLSAPLYEADFAPRKLRCDVLVNGSAYAPDGRPANRSQVSLSVGGWSKALAVIGDRLWEASPARPFESMPLDYGRAFGGTDDRSPDPALHAAFAANPSGRGFHHQLKREWVDGAPLPNTEELGTPVSSPHGAYRPMSFGPIGRHWSPRNRLAGTYDAAWLDEHFPFLPPDFSDEYYQSAPRDQQVPFPTGGEQITLLNLTPEGRTAFALPVFDAPIHYFRTDGEREDGRLTMDTLLIEPDLKRVSIVWRATRPLKKNMFEVPEIMVGKRSTDWWSGRETIAFPIPLTLVTSEPD
jgi:hypothetical protein